MATLITRKQLLDLLRPGIDELFLKDYVEIIAQTYTKEVDFDEPNRPRSTRRSTQTVRSTPSDSDGVY